MNISLVIAADKVQIAYSSYKPDKLDNEHRREYYSGFCGATLMFMIVL